MQNNQQKVKAYELRKQDESTLVQNLNKFRSELVGLRTSKVSSAPQVKLARIRVRKLLLSFSTIDRNISHKLLTIFSLTL